MQAWRLKQGIGKHHHEGNILLPGVVIYVEDESELRGFKDKFERVINSDGSGARESVGQRGIGLIVEKADNGVGYNILVKKTGKKLNDAPMTRVEAETLVGEKIKEEVDKEEVDEEEEVTRRKRRAKSK